MSSNEPLPNHTGLCICIPSVHSYLYLIIVHSQIQTTSNRDKHYDTTCTYYMLQWCLLYNDDREVAEVKEEDKLFQRVG